MREFNKDEDGTQKDAFIVLFAFITCKLCARDESDDLRYVLGKSLQKKDASLPFISSSLETNNFDENDRNNDRNNSSVSVGFLYTSRSAFARRRPNEGKRR